MLWKPVEPEDAATVILVREGDSGLEVYMTRRQDRLVFLGGYHVFPGGKVDEGDSDDRMVSLCPGLSPRESAARLGHSFSSSRSFGFFAAAARELFEEAGVLLAGNGEGERLCNPVLDLSGHRRDLQQDRAEFFSILEGEGLSLCLERLHWFAHWITPATSPRRFNTLFFIARKPGGQQASPFAAEVSDACWARPDEAISLWRRGEWKMIPPTVSSLDTLSRYSCWADLEADYSRSPDDHPRTVWTG